MLVFGLAVAPFLFTKVTRPLIKHWREQGITIFGFMDDFLGSGRSFEEAKQFSDIVRKDLKKSAFLEHPEKSRWVPSQTGEHLGFIVNLRD